MRKTPFICLLNAMEYAAQSADPLKEGHRDKRKAVLAYVSDLERRLTTIRAQTLEEAAKVCEGLPRKNHIQPADRRSRMANLCAAAIRAMK